MIIIHANLQVKPDQEQAFLEEMKSLLPLTRAEEGNISYELMKNTEKEHHYTMVELWKDVEATTSHNTSAHFTAFVQKAPVFMAAPMDLKVFAGEPVNR
ncbi:putative quinol monooxygenase [Paenibacillus macquariensis]|uniref:Quinol monooxygenase YgiN n=1 Tax=Paenibacillus macquariensis TaxID=948756 RepID=A0ABY1KAI6_9BACL|nr:putative quinol monooxygenase [Paenibacillus macquariensis]MEC0093707.1 putative quinol monooxygenase [Paenibacillus macquariensis]OAB31654.1 monooxygenase [Paenibacillus macquariensis subsp. macquariensis]SIR50608.1 Quinol monooxygenase YgiN [Paenibacillus macquariensis]